MTCFITKTFTVKQTNKQKIYLTDTLNEKLNLQGDP